MVSTRNRTYPTFLPSPSNREDAPKIETCYDSASDTDSDVDWLVAPGQKRPSKTIGPGPDPKRAKANSTTTRGTEDGATDAADERAVAKVFYTFELTENILLQLPLEDILRCERLSRRIRNFIDNSSPIQEKLWLSSSLVPAEGSSLTINPYLDPVFREYLAIDHGPYIRNLDNFFEQREKMASWRWMQLATPGHPIRVQCFQVDIGGPYGVPGFKLRGVWEHEWENGVSLEEFYEALPRVKNARMAWEIRCDANTAWVEEITRRWALWLDEWKLEVNLELLLQSTGLICCDYDLRVWMVSGFGI